MTDQIRSVTPAEQTEPNPRQTEGQPQLPAEPRESQSDRDRDARPDDVLAEETDSEPRR